MDLPTSNSGKQPSSIDNRRTKIYKKYTFKELQRCGIGKFKVLYYLLHTTSLENYKRHFDQCSTFKAIQAVNLSKKEERCKFSAHQATSMSPIVCYYNTESKLVPTTIYENATHKHEILSYKYMILDRTTNKHIFKIETGGPNLAENSIKIYVLIT